MHKLRFRQIHLDYHTSPHIDGIGADFDKTKWQDTLKRGHVNSITCFSKCHHGWSYHPTRAGRMHPHLSFDLLRKQFDACKEIDVNVPIYISAGVDNVASYDHPEWREIGYDGKYQGWATGITDPGFHKMCFNSPYLDYLCEQIREVAALYPDCDGYFLDIISQGQCCCTSCMDLMKGNGLDARNHEDRAKAAEIGLNKYYVRTTEACHSSNIETPVFHNSGHISPGNRDILKHFSHLELESLPTGGWGYDHFPMSAKYCQNLDLDFMGMTGKFHTTWGEFGGFKHPNALRYECAAMLAYGAKCSIGDQLHPRGELDESTYDIVGAAYREVEEKEQWCKDVESIADVGLLSHSALGVQQVRDSAPDTGAGRILLEGHFLFDVLDAEMSFEKYRMLILPDGVNITDEVKTKLDAYLAQGGKLFLTGRSGLDEDGRFIFDVGADHEGESRYQPDYIAPVDALRPDFVRSPFVAYMPSQQIRITDGMPLGDIHHPYFNRAFDHFCSHQHAPHVPDVSGYACGVQKGNIMYLAHPVFSMYRAHGAVVLKDYIVKALCYHLGPRTLETSLPSTGRVSLMHQPSERRSVLHLLYANTVRRGGAVKIEGGSVGCDLEVVEDLVPLHNVNVVAAIEGVKSARLQPQDEEVAFEENDGHISLTLDQLCCHQMIVLEL